ncbi:MAG: choice-of-anchor Q domain-containing protein [Actinomycetota bacterium]
MGRGLGRKHIRLHLGVLAAAFGVACALLIPVAASAATTDCSPQNLQNAIATAAPGTTILVSGFCHGNFVVDKTLTIKGNPKATLDGDDEGATVEADLPANATLHLVGLTITGGIGGGTSSQGGGIRATSGKLTLAHVVVRDNLSTDPSCCAFGGGIMSAGPLTLTDSSVVHNRALSNVEAEGGGIWAGSALTLVRSTVSFNRASAIGTGPLSFGQGGGIDAEGQGAVSLTSSHVDNNEAAARAQTATASGAGLLMDHSDTLAIAESTVSGNLAKATALDEDNARARGGGVLGFASSVAISNSVLSDDHAAADSPGSAFALGGAADLESGPVTLSGSRVERSRVDATSAGDASAGGGGVLISEHATLSGTTVSDNVVDAQAGSSIATASGGGALVEGGMSLVRSTVFDNVVETYSPGSHASSTGGGVDLQGPLAMSRSTVAGNFASSRSDDPASTGQAVGGGLLLAGSGDDSIVNSTVSDNDVSSVAANIDKRGAGIDFEATSLAVTSSTISGNGAIAGPTAGNGGGINVVGGTVTLKGTLLGRNQADVGPDCHGAVISLGHNLIQHTVGCSITPKSTDIVGKDPRLGGPGGLGVLQNNGGPTLTIAPTVTSPAIDAIAKTACPTTIDQRGVKRPQGTRCDIGAVELHS